METPVATSELEQKVIDQIKTIYDPEIPVDIYELGLIYDIIVNPDNTVFVRMTLTTPNCPSAVELPAQVKETVRAIPEVEDMRLELTFDPPYSMDMMSEAAKLELGFL